MISRKPVASAIKTPQLWNGLFNPPEDSPVFQRVVRSAFPLPQRLIRANRVLHPIAEAVLPVGRLVAAVCASLLLPVISNLIGLVFAYYVAVYLSRERERGTYDLLALTPAGEWDTTWTICLACIYRFRILWQVNFLRVMAVLGIIMLAFPLVTEHGNGVGTLIVAAIVLPLDAIQTIVAGCLCGILAQSYRRGSANTGIGAAAFFGAAQLLCVYLPAAAVYGGLMSKGAPRFLNPQGIAPIVALSAVVVFHEIVIQVLWAMLRRRMQ